MAVKWDPRNGVECWLRAEEEARNSMFNRRDCSLGFLYRFMEKGYSYVIDADAERYGSYYQVELTAIPIRSVTPCGWTIDADNGNGWRFVSRETQKRYACPTVMEALISYVERKKKQAAIYRACHDKANQMIMQAMCYSFGLEKAMERYRELTA